MRNIIHKRLGQVGVRSHACWNYAKEATRVATTAHEAKRGDRKANDQDRTRNCGSGGEERARCS